MAKLVNVKNGTICDVFIGRPSKWGNPFKIGVDGTRSQVIGKFKKHLVESGLIKDIGELRGKILGCF